MSLVGADKPNFGTRRWSSLPLNTRAEPRAGASVFVQAGPGPRAFGFSIDEEATAVGGDNQGEVVPIAIRHESILRGIELREQAGRDIFEISCRSLAIDQVKLIPIKEFRRIFAGNHSHAIGLAGFYTGADRKRQAI